jgi:hypothetical protein
MAENIRQANILSKVQAAQRDARRSDEEGRPDRVGEAAQELDGRQ